MTKPLDTKTYLSMEEKINQVAEALCQKLYVATCHLPTIFFIINLRILSLSLLILCLGEFVYIFLRAGEIVHSHTVQYPKKVVLKIDILLITVFLRFSTITF